MGLQYSVEKRSVSPSTSQLADHSNSGERRSIEELKGMSWHLKPPKQTSYRVPIKVAVMNGLNRSGMDSQMIKLPHEKELFLEKISDWDDDERSGRKILVIQEKIAQNQQEFLDKYLPQWDEQLANKKKESGIEWENPFRKQSRGDNHTNLHLLMKKKEEDMIYHIP
ncbi:hypothetical protein Tco_1313221 [Tanacetum coccineum]